MHFKIKKYREELGMSQAALAKEANVSRAIISGLESGRIKVTSTGTISKIAAALNKSVSDIFFD